MTSNESKLRMWLDGRSERHIERAGASGNQIGFSQGNVGRVRETAGVAGKKILDNAGRGDAVVVEYG